MSNEGGDIIGTPINLKVWKNKKGWSARAYIPAAVFMLRSRTEALRALDKLVREMTDCDDTCGCHPIYDKPKKQK